MQFEVWTTVIVLLLISIYAWKRYRDVLSPAVLHNVMWIAAIIGLATFENLNALPILPFIVIVLGSISFQVSFSFSYRIKLKIEENDVWPHSKMMKLLIIVLVIVLIPTIRQYVVYLRQNSNFIYNALTSANENINVPGLFRYVIRLIQYIDLAFLTIYFRSNHDRRKALFPYIIILTGVAVLSVASVPSRNSVLFFALPLIMIFISTHNFKNKTIIRILVVSLIAFLFVFYLISQGKYWYRYDDGISAFTIIKNELLSYLSGGVLAFSEYMTERRFLLFGADTFRFFVALYDSIAGTNYAIPLVNEFVNVGPFSTNVFTFYDFYIKDFGIVYSLLAQSFFAFLHGIYYRKMKKGDVYSTYIYAMLCYPLIMQFFQDQYISLLSTWIQIYIVGNIILKSHIFFKAIDREANK